MASLLLTGLAHAAPVAGFAASGILNFNEKEKEIIDLDSVLPSIQAINERMEEDGENSIMEKEEEFIDELITKIKEQALM